jgi:hypothetical protein
MTDAARNLASGQRRLCFCLGGQDLEMQVIGQLLRGQGGGVLVHDKGLAWGACASAYAAEIAKAARRGDVPVLVELVPDQPLPPRTILIDHHGDRAGEPCSLRQVFDLLGLPEAAWTRHFALVAANDTGHVAALRRMGATDAEIASVRAADRAAQGVTAGEEHAGLLALKASRSGLGGALLIVDLPHGRTATVMDPLALAGEPRDVLVLTPAATHFYGQGAAIERLDAAFAGGWRGGELPTRGFWGIGKPLPASAIEAALAR